MITADDLKPGARFTAASGTTITPMGITVHVTWVDFGDVWYRHVHRPGDPVREHVGIAVHNTPVARFLEIVNGINGKVRS